MISNSLKHSKKATMIVIFNTIVFFFFTLSAYADENQENAGDLFTTGYSLNEVDQPPRAIRVFPPEYPLLAKVEGIEGRVLLRLIIGADGYVQEALVDSAEPEGVFERAALDVIMKYIFKPALKNGEQVACIVKVPISFVAD